MATSYETMMRLTAEMETTGLLVVYSIPHQGFILKGADGRWRTGASVKKEAAVVHLKSRWTVDSAKLFMKSMDLWTIIYGFDLNPGAPELYTKDGQTWLNTWVPPAIVPKPGSFPTIKRVLNLMAKSDKAGVDWLVNWMAYKVQNQLAVPKIAPVFATAPGAGKGFLARVLSEILGPDNCATVKQAELDNRFNSRWIGKLFVFGDEIMSTENTKDISNLLKILIDGNDLELEQKGVDQITVKSKLAWMFASNDKVSPILLESNDRRYSVYANHAPLTDSYKAALKDCFEVDRSTCTAAFKEEIAAFAHELLKREVSADQLTTPYDNPDRANLIAANKPSFEAFLDDVASEGFDDLLGDNRFDFDGNLPKDRDDWDFGEKGILCKAFYKLYQKHCKASGSKPLKLPKFGQAVRNHGWERKQLYRPKKKNVWVYVPPDKSVVVPGA